MFLRARVIWFCENISIFFLTKPQSSDDNYYKCHAFSFPMIRKIDTLNEAKFLAHSVPNLRNKTALASDNPQESIWSHFIYNNNGNSRYWLLWYDRSFKKIHLAHDTKTHPIFDTKKLWHIDLDYKRKILAFNLDKFERLIDQNLAIFT